MATVSQKSLVANKYILDIRLRLQTLHYSDAMMSAMASQLTSFTIVYLIDYSGAGSLLLSESIKMCRPLDTLLHLKYTIRFGIQMSNIFPMGITFSFWDILFGWNLWNFHSHSLWAIFVKIWCSCWGKISPHGHGWVKIHPADTAVGAKIPLTNPSPYPFCGEVQSTFPRVYIYRNKIWCNASILARSQP